MGERCLLCDGLCPTCGGVVGAAAGRAGWVLCSLCHETFVHDGPEHGFFDRQPTLTNELVALRPLRADDWDALFAVASDPLMWEQHPSSDRYHESIFRVFFKEAIECGGALIASDVKTGEVIGSYRFDCYDPQASEIEIGWTFLARSHWGGRYNGEMKRLMLEHAFKFVDRVVLLIGPENMRSRRAAEKIGGVFTGTRFARGRENVVYEITADSGGRP